MVRMRRRFFNFSAKTPTSSGHPKAASRASADRHSPTDAIGIYRKPLTMHRFAHRRFFNATGGTRRCSSDASSLAVFLEVRSPAIAGRRLLNQRRKRHLRSRESPAPASIVSRLRWIQPTRGLIIAEPVSRFFFSSRSVFAGTSVAHLRGLVEPS